MQYIQVFYSFVGTGNLKSTPDCKLQRTNKNTAKKTEIKKLQ